MIVKVIKIDQLIEANEIAIEKNWPRHFKEHNFDEFTTRMIYCVVNI